MQTKLQLVDDHECVGPALLPSDFLRSPTIVEANLPMPSIEAMDALHANFQKKKKKKKVLCEELNVFDSLHCSCGTTFHNRAL
jgi:hypothetical protein